MAAVRPIKPGVGPRPPEPPRGGVSAPAMMYDPRVLYVHEDATVYRLPESADAVPLTVVIPVHAVDYFADALSGLVLQEYGDWRILVVCADPAIHAAVVAVLADYRYALPQLKVFVPKRAGWLDAVLNAALARVETEYWCRLDPDDLLHPRALQVMAAAIAERPADYYYTCRYRMVLNSVAYPAPEVPIPADAWSGTTFPFDHLITYRKAAIAQRGGFRSYDRYPNDAGWIAAYDLLAAGKKLEYVNAVLYYKREHPKSATAQERVAPADYRKGLILQHWPEHFRQSDEEIAVERRRSG